MQLSAVLAGVLRRAMEGLPLSASYGQRVSPLGHALFILVF